MATPIAVLAADTHLAPRSWSNRTIDGDAYYSFTQIIDFAVKHLVPVVLAGDVLDRQLNRAGPIVFLEQQLDRLAEVNLPCYFISGQHEADDVPWLSSHRTARQLHRQEITLGPMRIYGLDYCPAGVLQAELKLVPATCNMVVMHQVLAEFMGSIATPQGSIGDVPHARTVFVGDFHKYRDITTKGADGQDVHVISPGSTCLQDISEDSDKYFVALCTDGTFKQVPLKTRIVLERGVLSTDAEIDQFVSAIPALIQAARAEAALRGYPENIRTPLVHVAYAAFLEGAARRLTQAVGANAHLFLKELAPVKQEAVERLQLAQANGQRRAATMDGMAEAYLQQQHLEALQPDVQRLLQTNDVPAELRRMREEALAANTGA